MKQKLRYLLCIIIPILVALVFIVSIVIFLFVSTKAEESKDISNYDPINFLKEYSEKINFKTDISPADIEMLAIAIYQEAGGDLCCDICRRRVGDVVLNRVNDPRFPDTIEEVLTQKRQYGTLYKTGVIWPERSKNEYEKHAINRAYKIAREILCGYHSDVYDKGYIFQAEFPQGNSTDILYCSNCKIYFGK